MCRWRSGRANCRQVLHFAAQRKRQPAVEVQAAEGLFTTEGRDRGSGCGNADIDSSSPKCSKLFIESELELYLKGYVSIPQPYPY